MSCPEGWCRRAIQLRPDRAPAAPAPANAPERPKFVSELPPIPAPDDVVSDVVAFFKDPVKGFFRARRLHAAVGCRRRRGRHASRYQRARGWTVGDRMLGDILRGMTLDERGRLNGAGHAATRSAGLAQGNGDRDQPRCWRLPRSSIGRRLPGMRRRYRSRLRGGYWHGVTGVSVTAGFLRDVFQVGRQASTRVVDSIAGVDCSCPGSRLVGGVHRPRQAGNHARQEGLGRPDDPAAGVARELVALYDAGRRADSAADQDVLRLGGCRHSRR